MPDNSRPPDDHPAIDQPATPTGPTGTGDPVSEGSASEGPDDADTTDPQQPHQPADGSAGSVRSAAPAPVEDGTPEEPVTPGAPAGRSPGSGRWASALVLGLVIGLLAGAAFWAFGPVRAEPKAAAAGPTASSGPSERPGNCVWTHRTELGRNLDPRKIVSVGTPATSGERRGGPATLTVATDRGDLVVRMDAGATPCTVASLAYLARQGFYSGNACTGDPSGVSCGDRDPDYTFTNENLDGYPRALTSAEPVPGLPSGAMLLPTGTVRVFPTRLPTCPGGAAKAGCIPTQCLEQGGCSLSFFPLLPRTVEQVEFPAGTALLMNSGPGTNGGAFTILRKATTFQDPVTPFGTLVSGQPVLAALSSGSATITSVTVSYP